MLRLLGCGLILGAAAVLGLQLKQRLTEHLRQLLGFKEMLHMLSSEISYAKTPLAEAFLHISGQGKEPFGRLLGEVSKRLGEEREKSLYEIWQSAVSNHRDSFYFTREEFQILTDFGENLGYLDIKMQLNHIALYIQQVENRIVQAQEELAAKQKMYQYLSVMCGLFLILILL